MQQIYILNDSMYVLLNIAAKRGASDRIAAYEYCMEKKWLCGYGRPTDKGLHKVTANFCKDNPAIARST
jgi:hypothetical protein